MKKSLLVTSALASVLICTAGMMSAQVLGSPLVAGDQNHAVHVMPTPAKAQEMAAPMAPALMYHGGKIMSTTTTYAIFWLPPTLQDGTPTSMSSKYQSVIKAFLADYPSHTIAANNTQYYQKVNTTTSYIKGSGSFGGYYVDTAAYPASGCTDSAAPHGCITDAQVQAEISKVMTTKGWTGSPSAASPTKMFLLFTSSGEGSCFDSSSGVCAYTYYCAYHGSYINGAGARVVYGNEPYGDPTYCFYTGVQQAPSGDQPSDAAVNVASHEITEAITDPNLDAWYDSSGNEIGDICAWQFGTLTWDSSIANQMWNGHYYDLQMEYDNHASGCVQVGP